MDAATVFRSENLVNIMRDDNQRLANLNARLEDMVETICAGPMPPKPTKELDGAVPINFLDHLTAQNDVRMHHLNKLESLIELLELAFPKPIKSGAGSAITR